MSKALYHQGDDVSSSARETTGREIAAIPDLVDRACDLRQIARERGTLTPAEARLYREAIHQLHDLGLPASWIARKVGVSRGRVWQLICLHALSAKAIEDAAADIQQAQDTEGPRRKRPAEALEAASIQPLERRSTCHQSA